MSRHLTVILRTCQRINMIHDNGQGRYIKVSKSELINVCVSSLINSINLVKNHSIELIVLDDHSNDESVKNIQSILSKCKFPTKFLPVDGGTGNAYTMGLVYDIIEKQVQDLWYHVEDDYLHFPEAIQDMIDTIDQFEINTGQMVAVNPHDDVWRYFKEIYESYILFGPYRHYRTVKHTTYTCLASKLIYQKYKSHFQDVVRLTGRADWVEDKTINLIWNKPDVMLFSPIPGLALHIMDESGKDPYIDVDALWNSIPKLW